MRALILVILVPSSLCSAACGSDVPLPEYPPPDPPPEADTSGSEDEPEAATQAPTPAPSPAPAAPVSARTCPSGTFTVDANTRMDIPGHGPYAGAMRYDLTTVSPAPTVGESPAFPSVWAEPADPELGLDHLRITEPADLAGQTRVPRERIRAGLALSVSSDSGRPYRIEVVSFQAGPRATARMQLRIAETGCGP